MTQTHEIDFYPDGGAVFEDYEAEFDVTWHPADHATGHNTKYAEAAFVSLKVGSDVIDRDRLVKWLSSAEVLEIERVISGRVMDAEPEDYRDRDDDMEGAA